MPDHIRHGFGLNGYDRHIVFHMNFRPGVDLFLCVDAVPDKEVHILLGSVDRECVGRGGQVGKTPARRLGDPASS